MPKESNFERELFLMGKMLEAAVTKIDFNGVMQILGYAEFFKDSALCSDDEKKGFAKLKESCIEAAKTILAIQEKGKKNESK